MLFSVTLIISFASVVIAVALITSNGMLVKSFPNLDLGTSILLPISPYLFGIIGTFMGRMGSQEPVTFLWVLYCLIVSVVGYVGIIRNAIHGR